MSLLFSPITFRSVTLKNRIVLSPMCQYSAVDGFANDWHLVHLGSRAVGGAALIVTEAAAVTPEGRITPDDLGIWKDEHIEGLKKITGFIDAQGAVAGIQLAHAGHKASVSSEWKGNGKFLLPENGGWQIVAPSSVPFDFEAPIPLELKIKDIEKVTDDFRMAAKRAFKAGFKVLEIHAAHGYLLHEFLSPLSNYRKDKYGGSFENRIRLLVEVVEAVQSEWPGEYPLFVRISATDWCVGGWDIEESVRLAAILKEKGVDLIDVSSGGLIPHAIIPVGYGYQLSFAVRIKKETGIRVGTVGMITDAIQAETILQSNDADLIFIGREMLRNPYFALEAAEKLGDDIDWPVQYRRAKKRC
ncbi:MAG: NADPH dehydrogenase NamA [Bacteroidales bacterium]|nr:NADPH dehydrogenase NamA [Bacteroidales bacterium]